MFKIEVIGNLGGDAEIKNDNGRLYVQFSVADTRKFKKEDGTTQEVTNWISCFFRQHDSEVVKYLKKGARVFVRGNGDLRLFSSAKDRMMKAGASINVLEIELVGGQSDEVPRELALSTGQLLPVYKAYYIDARGLQQKTTQLFDRRGQLYTVDANGFISPQKKTPDETQTTDNAASTPQTDAQDSSEGNNDAPL